MSGFVAQRRELAFRALEERGLSSGDIRRLLDHPRNELLTMEGSRFHYVPPQGGNWVPLKGLTSLLREFYWPDHKPWGKKRKREDDDVDVIWPPPRPRKKPRKEVQQPAGWTPPILTAKGGVQGSIVHRQLAEYVNLGRDAFLAQNRHVHPLTRMALKTLSGKGLYPLVAEYRVACVDVRLGTAIDLLCINMSTGRPTWIEVKTAAGLSAFDGGSSDEAFSGRLAAINAVQKGALPVSDCSRARVQVGISVLMAVEGTGYKAGFDAFVLLLANDQREGKLYPVNEAFLQTFAVPLYLDIQKRLPEWRKSRQR
jgi:hypothetical protein